MKRKIVKMGRRVPKPRHVPMRWRRLKSKPPSRRFMVKPDPNRVQCFEVRVFRTRRDMQAGWQLYENQKFKPNDDLCMGRCNSYGGHWRNKTHDRKVMLWRYAIGRIYYNAQDLLARPAEIMSHEVTHAAMGWARYVKADLSQMAGEEIMCYAQGIMTMWVNSGIRFIFR